MSQVPEWAKGPIRYFGIFHDRVLGSRQHSWKHENSRKGKIYVFSPTRVSGFSRYRVMVKSPGVLLRRTSCLVPHARQLRFPFCYLSGDPVYFLCFLSVVFISYVSCHWHTDLSRRSHKMRVGHPDARAGFAPVRGWNPGWIRRGPVPVITTS